RSSDGRRSFPVYGAIIQWGLPSGVLDPSPGERRTAQDPPHGEREAADCPPVPDGHLGVLGAARIEAALAAQQPTQTQAIQADRHHEGHPGRRPDHPGPAADATHAMTPAAFRRPSRSAVTSLTRAPWISGRATTTTSHP